ncbi:unnamed protein product, partial [Ectocarpus fasciculatus]
MPMTLPLFPYGVGQSGITARFASAMPCSPIHAHKGVWGSTIKRRDNCSLHPKTRTGAKQEMWLLALAKAHIDKNQEYVHRAKEGPGYNGASVARQEKYQYPLGHDGGSHQVGARRRHQEHSRRREVSPLVLGLRPQPPESRRRLPVRL